MAVSNPTTLGLNPSAPADKVKSTFFSYVPASPPFKEIVDKDCNMAFVASKLILEDVATVPEF